MNAGLDIFCHRLLSALVNGGYQGLGITAVVWFGLKVFPRVNAATRHMVLLITLLLVVALPVAHYFLPNRGGTESLVNLSAVDSPAEAHALKAGEPSVSAESRHAWFQEDLRPRLVEEAPRVEAEVLFSDNSVLTRPDLESPWPRFRNDAEPEVPQAAELVGRTAAEFSMASDPGQDRGAEFLRWLTSRSRNWQFSLPDHLGIVLVGLWCLLTFLRLGLLAWQCCWLQFLACLRYCSLCPLRPPLTKCRRGSPRQPRCPRPGQYPRQKRRCLPPRFRRYRCRPRSSHQLRSPPAPTVKMMTSRPRTRAALR